MSDFPESSRSADAAPNDAALHGASEDKPPMPSNPDSLNPTMEEIDREVAEAMAEMAPADLTEICGDMTSSEDATPGTELTGTIVGLSEDEAFLEFGAKSQGVLPLSQFGKKEKVAIGRRVDVVVERFDPGGGLLIVIRKGEVQRATWMSISVGSLVEGRVTGLIKGGLEVNLQGIRAFMPGSQVSVGPMKDISVLLNETVRCEVIEIDRRSKNVIISRRKVLERDQAESREKLKAELEVGQSRKGVVRNITEFGAFVDLGGLEGLVHIRDLSWGTVEKVTDVLSTGQEIEVRVLKVDLDRNRISLGLKQTQPDPWAEVPQRYPVGTTLKVRIVRTADFGAFAELEPGVEGLIPLSETSWTRASKTTDSVSVGDMVDAVVIRVEPERHRLALSMKQAQPDPWDGVLDGFEEQSLTKGRVTRLADFGAFVEVAPGVEGLVHISELADRRVKSCGEVVQVGEEIEARVLGIDKENRRISLSLRQVKEPEQASAPSFAAAETLKPKKKRKKPLRGGLASHFDW